LLTKLTKSSHNMILLIEGCMQWGYYSRVI